MIPFGLEKLYKKILIYQSLIVKNLEEEERRGNVLDKYF